MPESSVRPHPIHGHRQEIGTQIESADNKRGRAEVWMFSERRLYVDWTDTRPISP